MADVDEVQVDIVRVIVRVKVAIMRKSLHISYWQEP